MASKRPDSKAATRATVGSGRRDRKIGVLVVDDHRTLAEALALAIGLEKDLEAHVASTGQEAVDVAEREGLGIVVLDEMTGGGGIEIIRLLKESRPESQVIVLTEHEDDVQKARAIEAGAAGFVSKLAPLAEVPRAVRKARAGEQLMAPEEVARFLRHLRHRRHQESTERQRANRLTPRHIQILQLLANGVPVQEISARLGMTPHTLRTHEQNILTRLGVHTKLEAVAVAIRHGKISTQS